MAQAEVGLSTSNAQSQLQQLQRGISTLSTQLGALMAQAEGLSRGLQKTFSSQIDLSKTINVQKIRSQLAQVSTEIEKGMGDSAKRISAKMQSAFTGFGSNVNTIFGPQFAALARGLASTDTQVQKFTQSQVKLLQQSGILNKETVDAIKQVSAQAQAYGRGAITVDQFREKLAQLAIQEGKVASVRVVNPIGDAYNKAQATLGSGQAKADAAKYKAALTTGPTVVSNANPINDAYEAAQSDLTKQKFSEAYAGGTEGALKYERELAKAKQAQEQLVLGLREVTRTVQLAYGPLSGIASRISSFTEIFKVSPLFAAAAVSVAGLGFAFHQAVKEGTAFQQFTSEIDGLLRTAAKGVGYTRDEIVALTDSIDKVSIIPIEQIREGARVLLSFPGISGDVFARSLKSATDIAAVYGDEIPSAARRLARSLEDPANNLEAITRLGITFNKTEREKISLLEDTGRLEDAQSIILSKVESHFKGAAEAAGKNTFSGAVDDLHDSLRKLFETISVKSGLLESMRLNMENISKAIQSAAVQGKALNLGTFFKGIEDKGITGNIASFGAQHLDAIGAGAGGLVLGQVAKSIIGLFGPVATLLTKAISGSARLGVGAAAGAGEAALAVEGGAATLGATGLAATVTTVIPLVLSALPLIVGAVLAYMAIKGNSETTDDRLQKARDALNGKAQAFGKGDLFPGSDTLRGIANAALNGPSGTTLDKPPGVSALPPGTDPFRGSLGPPSASDAAVLLKAKTDSVASDSANKENALAALKPDLDTLKTLGNERIALEQQIKAAKSLSNPSDDEVKQLQLVNTQYDQLAAKVKSVSVGQDALNKIEGELGKTRAANAAADSAAASKAASERSAINLQNERNAADKLRSTYDQLGNSLHEYNLTKERLAAFSKQGFGDKQLDLQPGTLSSIAAANEASQPQYKLAADNSRELFALFSRTQEGDALLQTRARIDALNKAIAEGALIADKGGKSLQAYYLATGDTSKIGSPASKGLLDQAGTNAQAIQETQRSISLKDELKTLDDQQDSIAEQLRLVTETKSIVQGGVELARIKNDLEQQGVSLNDDELSKLTKIVDLHSKANEAIKREQETAKSLQDTFSQVATNILDITQKAIEGPDLIGKHGTERSSAIKSFKNELSSELQHIPLNFEHIAAQYAVVNPIKNLINPADHQTTISDILTHLTGSGIGKAKGDLDQAGKINAGFQEALKSTIVQVTIVDQSGANVTPGYGTQSKGLGSVTNSSTGSNGLNGTTPSGINFPLVNGAPTAPGTGTTVGPPSPTLTNATNLTTAFAALTKDGASVSGVFNVIKIAGTELGSAFGSVAKTVVSDISEILGDIAKVGSTYASSGGSYAQGAAFYHGTTIGFAGGAAFDSPVQFPMSGGRRGVFAEAGPEAIMPLHRGSDGSLGVKAHGSDGGNSGGSDSQSPFLLQVVNNTGNNEVQQKRVGDRGIQLQIGNMFTDDIETGGPIAKSIERKYSLKRKTTNR